MRNTALLALLALALMGAQGGTTIEESSLPAVGVVTAAPEPLAEPAFKPFGQIIEVPADAPPTSESAVVRYWGGLAKARFHEEIEFGVLKIRMRDRVVAELERHRRSPEFLVALDGDFFLPVAPYSVSKGGNALPDAARVKVFHVRPGQAVLLHRGVWHAQPFPRAGECLFISAARDGTFRKDTVPRPFRGREAVKF
jgi:ureidoglycolate lyase